MRSPAQLGEILARLLAQEFEDFVGGVRSDAPPTTLDAGTRVGRYQAILAGDQPFPEEYSGQTLTVEPRKFERLGREGVTRDELLKTTFVTEADDGAVNIDVKAALDARSRVVGNVEIEFPGRR